MGFTEDEMIKGVLWFLAIAALCYMLAAWYERPDNSKSALDYLIGAEK
jgi:hypothetical protein